ncbi:MAG TPA: CPBP family intramembrane metalloprotease [Prolixibacteraceae bacterium]|nr:CPBP family intramembrane metalloprotease [Prolixibacteraceae bacterium]
MEQTTSPKALYWFLGLTFALSWGLAGIFILLFPDKDKTPFTIMAVLFMFMPLISVLITEKLIMKRKSLRSLAVNFQPNWWYLAAWPGMIAISFISLGVNILWPGISFTPDMSGLSERMAGQLTPEQIEVMKAQMEMLPIPYFWVVLGQMLVFGITINALAGFGEELGWRGFLVKEYRHLTFADASLRIGIIWGIWHAPIILMGHNYPQHPVIGVGMMVIWCMLLSPLFLYIRIKTHSVIGASIFHGTLNASAGLSVMYIAGGNDITSGITGYPGFVALALVIAIMVIYDRGFSRKPVTNCTLLEGSKK